MNDELIQQAIQICKEDTTMNIIISLVNLCDFVESDGWAETIHPEKLYQTGILDNIEKLIRKDAELTKRFISLIKSAIESYLQDMKSDIQGE
jgi:hypothetical protein